jgi:hypothetical protein
MKNIFALLVSATCFLGCNLDTSPLPSDDPAGESDAGVPDAMQPQMDCTPGEIRDEVCRTECGADNSYYVCRPTRVWECMVLNPLRCETPEPDPDPTPAPDCDDAVYWRDADADGYGNPTDYIVRPDCDPVPAGYVLAFDPDCNDSDRSSRPGGYDRCGDGIDQDCSGLDLACSPTCTPHTEVCGNGVDEDCDGTADDGCASGTACERDARYHTPCVLPATSSRCTMAGVWSCVDGSLMCALTVPVASTEVCGDGLDQDCNGSDISCSSACTPRTEVCGDGIDQDCNGLDMACPSGCTVRTEICGNGIDEDCNGSDLACTSTGRRTVYELYVPGDSWDPRSFRLRNGSWWGDENIVTCLNTGSQEMQSMAGGWHVCVTNGPVNPFIGSYRATGTSSDLSTFDTSLGACAMASGILWRVHDEATGASLITAGLSCDTSTSGGAPRHRF